ncbi:DUF4406 domain-containing protein [Alicyclobacillus acidocaldarius]|uniref:DUF4406 domain-containing protein n=1 Tax=Alicyclobacillus acidocaldarius subsp. acidocaldarius (strain ATCC 27009 / DSM 446 / BCRC 14685 / JCM 5260 / KCTC 1825 / NBRC 15652 / NCIMB 11725 / NRRL B-14509 / 104-IA) TaxID=521098 RepID=C8WSN4_ALIAD|nr:DUF4406 domain-containing protein [Alicyclobacillus acidocaldarius]ACV57540.1 hypothetical protein Aaci_0482 [Alicyclobacillus acidocaldarius subsp. acidocaldarius DSM 446]
MNRVALKNLETLKRDGRWYLAGPMSGYPDFNRPAFHEAAARLRAQGLIVVNPAEIRGDEDCEWDDWMRAALHCLLGCHAVVFLPGWEFSRGAQLEYMVATGLEMPVFEYRDGEITPLVVQTARRSGGIR